MMKILRHVNLLFLIGLVFVVSVYTASCSCGDNEVWDSCIKPCPPRICGVNESVIRCAAPPQPGDPDCVAGCRCADNLYKNDKGVCVPKNQCPKKCGVNEIQTSCIQAICEARNCSDLGKPIRCVRIDTQFCTSGCLCKEGYLRNPNGDCVPIKQCPSKKACGRNEIPTPCFEAICERRNCSDLEKPFSCVRFDPQFCTEGCLCKEGYLRNKKGFCVPIDQCPNTNVCGKNEIPTSCFQAICERRNCSDIGKPVACVRLDPSFCTDGCLCKEGYLRNDANGVCVPIGQCPNIQCGPNEIFDPCVPPCPGEGCGVDPSLILCLPNPQPGDPDCNPGCRCQDNYFRNDYGFCVTRDECPKPPTVICGPDEVPTDCVNGGCSIWYCSQTQEICNLLLDEDCKPGCSCRDGFLRAENGTCISADQCPPKCGLNEYFSCGGPCDNVCATLNTQNQTNCPLINKKCNPKCYCQEGYASDDNNICIPIKKYPPPKKCGVNEIQTSCIQASCEPRNCSDLGKPIRCVRIDTQFCTSGCICKEGYLRNPNGDCVPIRQCPSKNVCGKNEIPTSCFQAICERRNCSDIGKPVACVRLDPSFCTDGCLCKEGYLRNDANGVCVPIGQCPNIQCGPNEIFDPCVPPCPGEGCGVDPSLILCLPNPQPGDPDCNPGCRCQDNYFRNDYGFCVTRDECPKPPTVICGPDEVPTDCVNGGCGIWYCSQTQEICNLLLDEDCKPGCLCRDGFLRAENGTCITADQCPPKCGLNEYFSCGGPCDNVCSTLNTQNQTNCPLINKKCSPKCYCQEGYARDDNNICIPIKKCPPPVCGINEIFDICPAPCPPKNCDDLGKFFKCKAPPKPGDPECNPGCRCADNYYRNKQGACVPKNECPLKCYGQNEVVGCQNNCSPQTCESIGKKYNCPLQPANAVCEPACVCKKDYYRNINGQCVSKEDCLKCTGPNEYFSCGGACDNVCATLAIQNQNDCPIVNVVCNEMCYCKEGYARDSNNTCIPISKCPPPTCGPNEVAKEQRDCTSDCCPQPADQPSACPDPCSSPCKCSFNSLREPTNGTCIRSSDCPAIPCGKNEQFNSCPSTSSPFCSEQCSEASPDGNRCSKVVGRIGIVVACRPGCVCKDNYWRNGNNECVPYNECSKPNITCGPDEVYDSCVNGGCGRWNCSQPGEICIKLAEGACREGCRCKKGMLRTDDGICVPEDQCPTKRNITCGPDEVYDSCANGGCRRWNCSQPEEICINLIEGACREGCLCKEGMLRNEDGMCIPADQCPINCLGQNEIRGCQINCPPQTCESIGKKIKCPPQTKECIPACRCKEGYYRNKRRECISKADCLKCTGPNEFFSCGGACDNVCATLAIQNQNDCPIVNVVCNEMCYCEEGYARDINNTCIPISKCPPPTCGPNEVAKQQRDCTSDCCPQPADQPSACPDPCSSPCKCSFNSLREPTNGTCIRSSDCPAIPCGKNEQFNSCPATSSPFCSEQCSKASPDGNRCSKVVGQIKIVVACRPGCVCIDNFWRNDENECVPYDECSKPNITCGPDEVYDSCVNGGCGRWNCSQPGEICIKLSEGACREGCRCKKGLLRSDDGICIPEDQCPTPTCGKNEVYVTCLPTCQRTCDFDPRVALCAPNPLPGDPQCKPGCCCIDKYFRNKFGQCVRKDQCDNNNNTSNGLKEFEQGNVGFTLRFLYEAAKAKPGVSLIISPFSVLFLLAQLLLYATGTLLEQLLRLLNLDSKAKIRSIIPNYLDTLSAQKNVTINLAAKTYANRLYELTSNFKTDTREIFNAEAQNLDFSKPNEAARIINAWVEEKTNNLIKNLVPPNSLNSDTVLVLVNAIYFKGDWLYPFDPKNTRTTDFYVDKDKTVQVNMMSRTGSYKYAEIKGLNAQVIELPYKSENFSLMICLPMAKDGINNLLDGLSDSNFSLDDIRNNMRSTNSKIKIPAFNISSTWDLKEYLIKKNNVPALFENLSGLQDISKNPKPIYVSSGIQKATIIVNELGSEAAAANAVVVSVTAVQQSIQLTADHPFIYFILYKGTPLFCGIYFADV